MYMLFWTNFFLPFNVFKTYIVVYWFLWLPAQTFAILGYSLENFLSFHPKYCYIYLPLSSPTFWNVAELGDFWQSLASLTELLGWDNHMTFVHLIDMAGMTSRLVFSLRLRFQFTPLSSPTFWNVAELGISGRVWLL